MIDRLIKALDRKAGMSAVEIADLLWLALQMQESESESVSSGSPIEEKEEDKPGDPERRIVPEAPKTTEPDRPLEERQAPVYPRTQEQTSKSLDLSFKAPNAPSLRQPLTLARALKPLMRRVPAGTNLVLDEAATSQRIADEGLWLPVLRPTLESWLDLELVVDESISMQIWRQTVEDLEKLLKNYGIFRDVRVWALTADDQKRVRIYRGMGRRAKNPVPRSPKELIDGSGRRLVLVASDCVSPFWRDGKVTAMLELWANRVPTAIIQMLPQWLWKRTALGGTTELRLRALTPGVSNRNLIAEVVSLWEEDSEERGVKLPVFTLEADKAASWAQMLSGKGSVWTSGVAFELDATPVHGGNRLFNRGELTAEKRVQGFWVTASPMARKLAGLLAAAPVITLPVVRLIREALLRDSLQVNVAEVFLGGLLKPLSEIEAETNPDEVLYDFMDGVRDLLLDSVPSSYALDVVDEVSKHVAKKAGFSLEDFAAVLRGEKEVGDGRVAEKVGYFATVTAGVLRRLGGEYAKVAEELESDDKAYSRIDVQTNLAPLSDIQYQLGGSLRSNSSSYVKRKADDALFNALNKGELCIVFAPRQMGKSSLRVQVMKLLKEEGLACATVDLTILGIKLTEKKFYAGFIDELVRRFQLVRKINFNLKYFVESCSELNPSIWLTKFFNEILLKEFTQPIVIFIDEIDAVLHSDFSRDFFLVLRSLYERKVENPDFARLNFVLLGVFLDDDLIQDVHISPFNIGVKINLEGFTYEEALPLAGGLAEKTNNPQELLKFILYWTGGQPFLTQKLCMLAKSSENHIAEGNEKAWLDNLVKTQIIERWEEQDSPEHFRTIRDRILFKNASQLLKLYQSILQEDELLNYDNQTIRELILTGLVVRAGGRLQVANPIYVEIFNPDWLQINLDRLQALKEDNLARLLDKIIPQNSELFEEIIEDYIRDYFSHKQVKFPEIPSDDNEASIIEVVELSDIKLKPEMAKNDNNCLFTIRFTLNVDCLLSYFIFKGDYYILDDKNIMSLEDINDHYFMVEAAYFINVKGIISVTANSDELESSRLSNDELLKFLEDADIFIDSITSIEVASDES